MKRLILLAFLFVFFANFSSLYVSPCKRTSYNFHVHYQFAQVYVNKNGSATIKYTIALVNHISEGIDYIDVGMPNPWYTISKVIWSWNNGSSWMTLDAAPSEVLSIGIQVYIPYGYRISSGEEGILIVEAVVDKMVFHDREKAGYAGVEFSPSWFGSEYCTIVENQTTWIYFPENMVDMNVAYWHHRAPDYSYIENNRLVFAWSEINVTPKQFFYGISFPSSYVNKVYDEFWDYALPLFIEEYGIFLIFIGLVCICCGIGIVDHVVKRRHYLKPLISVEGLGINRGLTAAEAAVVLELPLTRVVTIIIYGLLRKNAIKLESGKVCRIIPNVDLTSSDLRYYERKFLECVRPDGTLDETLLKNFLYGFIKIVADKMKGFSLTQTRTYYKNMIDRALDEMQRAKTEDAQLSAFENNIEWLLLEEAPHKKVAPMAQYHTHYHVPHWYVYHVPSGGTGSTTGGTSSIGGTSGTSISLPQLANAMAYSTQTFANNLAVNFNAIASYIAGKIYPSSSGGTRSGGFHSGGCACASCACACAGGGR
ncbi:MAG: hypothetical protein QXL15_01920 [Candidatus Korarchaeota archaeon]